MPQTLGSSDNENVAQASRHLGDQHLGAARGVEPKISKAHLARHGSRARVGCNCLLRVRRRLVHGSLGGDTIAVFLGNMIIVLPSPPIVNRKFDKVCFTIFPQPLTLIIVTKSHNLCFYFVEALATFIIQKRTSFQSFGQRSNSSSRSESVGDEPFCVLGAFIAADFATPEGGYPCFSEENAVCSNLARGIF